MAKWIKRKKSLGVEKKGTEKGQERIFLLSFLPFILFPVSPSCPRCCELIMPCAVNVPAGVIQAMLQYSTFSWADMTIVMQEARA